ncbi:proline--tRNA ligase [Omnitrophica bacterium]|nr:proline--tRNA ligase [Candidatus Omnitrophota bacterium]
MRWSNAFIPTLREDPADAEAISHKLMVRASLIRRLGSGTYSYLPLGLKALQKVENIIREEMNREGSLEVLLPAIHPVELWKKTGRFDLLQEILITYKDRSGKVNVFGPTHEEIITDLVAKEARSYRDLPKIIYQIQTKFRDEPRPRFGVLRSKEFIMKDAYSFDTDWKALDVSYKKMYDAYCRIFDRCGIDYIVVEADSGFMGGDVSHEFMAPAECGEDRIVACRACDYAASLEKAECNKSQVKSHKSQVKNLKPVKEVDTPGVSTVEKVSEFLKVKPSDLVKTLIYQADDKPVAVLVRGDHELNETKLRRILKCDNLLMADEGLIKKVTGGPLGFSGPVGLKDVRIVADFAVLKLSNFITGANKEDKHLMNVNLDRDVSIKEWTDLRYIMNGDTCPRCGKKIEIKTAIELGHTFKLGTKYSASLGARYLDEEGNEKDIIMGCYGIGVNRILAAAIEQSNDKNGVIWPLHIAPYQVVIIVIDPKDKEIMKESERIYNALTESCVDVLLDDRDVRPGIKFKDADLIGIPLQVIVGKKHLKDGKVELKTRKTQKHSLHSTKEILPTICKTLKK